MNGPSLHNLLSAYLDGELSASERQQVEAELRANPTAAAQLAEMRQVKAALGSLPPLTAPPGLLAGFAKQLAEAAIPVSDPAQSGVFLQALLTQPEQLLNAYLDDELTADHRGHIESQLLVQAEHRRTLNSMAEAASLLRDLPIEPAPAEVLEQVMTQLQPTAESTGARSKPDQNDQAGLDEVAPPGKRKDKRRRPAAWLLSAYLDHELTADQRQVVERKLARSARWRSWLRDQKRIRRMLETMPRLKAEPGSLERALETVAGSDRALHETRTWNGTQGQEGPGSRSPRIAPPRHESVVWAFRATSALALAASIVLFIGFVRLFSQQSDVHELQRNLAKAKQAAATVDRDAVVARPEPRPAAPAVDPHAILQAMRERHWARRPVNAEAVADAPSPKQPFKPDSLPVEQLKQMKPGDVVTTLDGKQLKFVCVDVKRVYDQLRIVLLQHQIPLLAGAAEQEPSPSHGHPRPGSQLYVIDVSATPERVRDVLAELRHEEKGKQLISQVALAEPDEQLLMDLLTAVGEKKPADWPVVPVIVAPNEPLAHMNSARGIALTPDRLDPAKPSLRKNTQPDRVSKQAEPQRTERADPTGGASKGSATPTQRGSPTEAVPAKSEPQVRFLLVLEQDESVRETTPPRR